MINGILSWVNWRGFKTTSNKFNRF